MRRCRTHRCTSRAVFLVFLEFIQMISEIECSCPSSYYPPTHTACLDPSPYSINPKGVGPAQQVAIVAEHNAYRASVDATDMQMLYWDNELAFVAQKLAENCTFAHDPQRGILCKYSAGQNLALGYPNWAAAIQAWYNETYKFTYGGSSNIFSEIGHYTQVMWSGTAKVGCGFSYCSNYNQPFYVCNYALPGNLMSRISRPYAAGPSCSDCPNHCNNRLCDCGGLVCKNGGVLNISTCTCSCQSPYLGSEDCNLNCTGVTDSNFCNRPQPYGYPPEFCSIYTNVPRECPVMCGVCPASACLELQATAIGDQPSLEITSNAVTTPGVNMPTSATNASSSAATPAATSNPLPTSVTPTAENVTPAATVASSTATAATGVAKGTSSTGSTGSRAPCNRRR